MLSSWLIAVLLTVTSSSAASFNSETRTEQDLEAMWTEFKIKFNRVYGNAEEDAARKEVFVKNVKTIEQHNALYDRGLSTYRSAITKFSDRFAAELKTMNGLKLPSHHVTKRETQLSASHASLLDGRNANLNDSFDWRKKGAVTPVRYQGYCGSCWAFSAVGALEGQHFITYGKLVPLSVQNLVDCASIEGIDYGCRGGYPEAAMWYVMDNGGIDTEASYPYEAVGKPCRFNSSSIGTKIKRYTILPARDEDLLMAAVANLGPISICLNAEQLQYYDSGIFDEHHCPRGYSHMTHAVLIVGFGTENGTDYWIVKNSWGEDWGELGYFRILRNKNLCGLANLPVLPMIDHPKPHLCKEPVDPGEGTAYILKWYYHYEHNACETFRYRGTKGNDKRFDTKAQCEAICMA